MDSNKQIPKITDCCGCCGRGLSSPILFCTDCAAHVLPNGHCVNPEDRTYFARFGADCPFQEERLEPFELTTCSCGDVNCEGCEPDPFEVAHSRRWANTRMVINPTLAINDNALKPVAEGK